MSVTHMELSEAAKPTPQRAQSRRRWQRLTGGGSGCWKQQIPGREWQSAHCCPVACKKQKLRVEAKQPVPKHTGAGEGWHWLWGGGLRLKGFAWTSDGHTLPFNTWEPPSLVPPHCLQEQGFFSPLPPTPWSAREESIVPQPSTSLCFQSHHRVKPETGDFCT